MNIGIDVCRLLEALGVDFLVFVGFENKLENERFFGDVTAPG